MPDSLNEAVTRSLNLSTQYQQTNQFTGKSIDNTTYEKVTWLETRTGVQNPRWRDQVQQMSEAGTAYSRLGKVNYTLGRRELSVFVPNFYGRKPVPNDYYEKHKAAYVFLPGTPISSSKAYASALGNFLKNINDVLSPFKGMTFLGELRETLKMLRRPASTLRDGFSAYLKRARHEVRRHGSRSPKIRKVLSDTWLEYHLGWKPLIGSIKDAAEAYEAYAQKAELVFVKGVATDETAASSATYVTSSQNYCRWMTTDKRVDTSKVVFKGMVVHRYNDVNSDAANRIIRLSGFRFGEFIPTVWELIPYSFVVDYFSNIGDILNSISALSAELRWKSCSRWESSTREVGFKADLPLIRTLLGSSREPQIVEGGSPSKATRVNYSRSIPELTVPELVLSLPSNPWQWTTLAALINAKL